MIKTLVLIFLLGSAAAFTAVVTSNLYNFGGFYNKLGDGVGFDAGTSMALGPDCVEFQANSDEAPEVAFDWGANVSIKTIYLMGSVKNNDDLLGMEMKILEDSTGNWVSCPAVDGSGFYSCSVVGRYLKLSKTSLSSKFTICEVTIYEEENLTPLVQSAV